MTGAAKTPESRRREAIKKAGGMRAPLTVTAAEIRACIDADLTSYQAAERLGCRRNGLLRQCRRLGIRWPYDPAKRAAKPVYARGRWWSLAEIAREVGTTRTRIRMRYKRGDRGERLFRPLRRYGPDELEIGLSEREWLQIGEYARAHGVEYTADKFGVPIKGVQIAVSGPLERLG